MKKVSVRVIYDRIEKDLTDVIKILPDAHRNGEASRPNKGMALVVLIEVYISSQNRLVFKGN